MKRLDSKKLKQAIDYISSWIGPNFQNSRLPGLQVAIQHQGKLLYSGSYGYANIAKNEKLTDRHLFRIASHSKTFTATAIMQLREKGKLHLDDRVSKHLTWFKSSRDPRISQVTIGQLLNHTAGIIRDGEDADFWQLLRPFPTDVEMKKYIGEAKLIYNTDERFKYSNFGFGFLGLLVQAISGISYSEYVKKEIISKLGLKSTGPDLDDMAREHLATGYSIELYRRPRRRIKQISTNALAPATGFYSNAEDTCTYFSAHFLGNTTLLSDASKRSMQHGNWETGEPGGSYGLGVQNYAKPDWSLIGHGGGFPGFITNTRLDPERKLVVVALTNASDGPAGFVTTKIVNIIDKFQQTPGASGGQARKFKKFTGRFYTKWGPLDIVAIGSKLYALDNGWWNDFEDAEELKVVDSSTLRIEDAKGLSSPGEQVRYKFNKDGKVLSVKYAGRSLLTYRSAVNKGWF